MIHSNICLVLKSRQFPWFFIKYTKIHFTRIFLYVVIFKTVCLQKYLLSVILCPCHPGDTIFSMTRINLIGRIKKNRGVLIDYTTPRDTTGLTQQWMEIWLIWLQYHGTWMDEYMHMCKDWSILSIFEISVLFQIRQSFGDVIEQIVKVWPVMGTGTGRNCFLPVSC